MRPTVEGFHWKWLNWLWLPLLAVGFFYFQTPSEEAAPDWNTIEISRGELVATVSATGTLNPLITVLVGSQVSGTIASLEADFNQPVKTGDVIARIEPSLFKAKLAEAQANVKNAEAARDKAIVAISETRSNLDRISGLQARKLVSDSEVDAARFALEAAEVEKRVKEAAVDQANAQLDHERFNLDHTIIRAPIDGVVISRTVDVGQTVAASLQAPTLYTIAQDLTRMQIETDVDETFIGQVKPGQPVQFTVFAYPQREFTGELAQVRLEPKVDAGVVKYNCIIHVDNSDLSLKPGMTATVSIEVDRRNDVLKVANSALRFVPQMSAEETSHLRRQLKPGQSILWTVSDANLEPRTVQTGLMSEKETEIEGAGLSAGTPVAVPQRSGDKPRQRRGFSLF
jgi:HlyD family secretion protein